MVKLAAIILLMLFGLSIAYAQDDLSNTSVNITSPKDGDTVSVRETVRGTSSGIPEVYELWVAVNPLSVGRFYIQDQGRMMMADGRWSGLAYLGRNDASDSGMEFDIYAVLANESANQTIVGHVEECKKTGNWPGLAELPPGATIMDLVTVVRQ